MPHTASTQISLYTLLTTCLFRPGLLGFSYMRMSTMRKPHGIWSLTGSSLLSAFVALLVSDCAACMPCPTARLCTATTAHVDPLGSKAAVDKTSCSASAQVLVYFAVAKMGDTPSGGNTELNPEGLTAATGKHAQAVASLFAKGGLSCKVTFCP